jgi:hypothetical protein
MIRKPTYLVLALTLFFVGLYAMARHDLVANCPDFFKKPPLHYVTPDGADDLEDGSSFEGCTNADPVYLDMQQWQLYFEIGFVLVGLLTVVDVCAFIIRKRGFVRVGRRGERPISPGVKILLKISNFFGGF